MANSNVKNNVLIASFMDVKVDDQGMSGYDWDDLEYHCSWDWLMPVIEKIERLDPNDRVTNMYSVDIGFNGTTISPSMWAGDRWMIRHNSRNRRLLNTYDAIVEFINWYNENKS